MKGYTKNILSIASLLAVVSSATADPGVIPGFPEDGGSSAPAQGPGQVVLPNPNQVGTGSYYTLPNGDLIGPDGTRIPNGAAQVQNGGRPVITNPTSDRLSPTAGMGQPGMPYQNYGQQNGQVSTSGSALGAKIQGQVNMVPEVRYNPDGTVTVLPLPDMRDPFATAKDVTSPLSPNQIREIKKSYQENRRAMANGFHGEMPTPVTSQLVLDLSPKAPPPVVRVIPGNGSVISFRDITGAAWPVIAYQSFNSRDFEVTQPIKGSNLLSISALNNYANGNVSIVLQNYSTPIIVSMLSTSAKETDSKLDIQVPLVGPNAQNSAVPPMKPSDADLLQVLYGVLPSGSKRLKVDGAVAKAWKTSEGDILLTGALQVVSPSPIQREGNGDGYYAYRLANSPVFLVNQNGTERKLVVKEAE